VPWTSIRFCYSGSSSRKREEKIAKLREQAIAEVWKAAGYKGILRLCENSEAANIIVWQLALFAPNDLDPVELIFRLSSDDGSGRST
jgi:hypothetical protein